MFYVEFVCLLFSLSVSNSGLHENFTNDVSVDSKEFWKSSAPGSGNRNFFEGFFVIVRLGIFPNSS